MWKAFGEYFDTPHDAVFFVKLGLIAAVVTLVGIFGIPDLLRLSIKRIWAISGVCYQESIRRKVLWIIPLAILGLLIVVVLQRPMDEQDAIRQTTKFCIFATGMVVVISTIILACTNLPREIENRVIFTVVTKPTTRLEIILGKITGFARVSATILLIMLLLSYGGLSLQAWSFKRDINERLGHSLVDANSRPTFQHYVDSGLLNAKSMALPMMMNIYGKVPTDGSTRRYPTPDGMIRIPFQLPQNMWFTDENAVTQNPSAPGFRINVRAGFDPLATTRPTGPRVIPGPPKVGIAILDSNANTALAAELKNNPAVIPPPRSSASTDKGEFVSMDLPVTSAQTLVKYPIIFIAIRSGGGDGDLWVDIDPKDPPVTITVPLLNGTVATLKPVAISADPTKPGLRISPEASIIGSFLFTGQEGVIGQQVKGDHAANSQVAVFDYQGLDIQHGSNTQIPVEFRVGVEKSGEAHDQDVPTSATLTVINTKTGKSSPPIAVTPENNRPFYASIPSDAVEGGDFRVIVRCLTDDQWLNLGRNSLSVVQAEDSFALNLLKSGMILWLLSILVTAISVFCSTFLSWPIAVVLTLVILLGRWTVNELGDAATAGLGRQVALDFGVKDVVVSQMVSGSVEELNKALKAFATVLPDIEGFAATDNIDHGISIPSQTLWNATFVLLGFGLPLTLMAYIFLKNKEVAP